MAIKKISNSSLFSGTRYSKVMAATSQVQDVVDPPTITSVTAGGYKCIVAFTPKTTGSPASSYTVTATPGGATASGASSPITITGLTPGTAYTFKVKGTNNRSIVGNETDASASATPDASFPIEYVVVAGGAGGGAGGNAGGAGGGGGGYRSSVIGESSGNGTAIESTITGLVGNTYAIAIGGGGGGGADYGAVGGPGSASQFGAITTTGGGRGGGGNNRQGGDGGSGGGSGAAGGANLSGGNGISGQGGNGGGSGFSIRGGDPYDYYYGSGSGGGGNSTSITSSSLGMAGGGGGLTTYGFGGGGGSGGGPGAGSGSFGQAGLGTTNRGGGGGGSNSNAGGNGGSGIVILRYPSYAPDIASIPGGLTYTKTTPTGYKVYQFTNGSGTITL